MILEEINTPNQVRIQLRSMMTPVQDDGYGNLHWVESCAADQAAFAFILEDLH